MTAQDKLALGMILFIGFFVVGFLAIPQTLYRRYYAELERHKRGRLVKQLVIGVFVLSLPYFYDQLVGLDSKALSTLLGLTIGTFAYLVLIDVAWFAYKNYGPPSQRPKPTRK
jgi:hypothetical protein